MFNEQQWFEEPSISTLPDFEEYEFILQGAFAIVQEQHAVSNTW
ncbi:16459_t:CDS:2 [Dentiscutata heterogama]|uniref:16459_t:CDS:1 n=1 Tax=Dentiscutata heterogama TaxID=1316150 RepID=A0ACA9K732_9GLOM|nr:16459_t:CDS:2 [Dentiscutata heterogama]